MLALAPHDLTPRVVHLAPSEYRAIVAELEADPDFPAPVAGRCALCRGPLTPAEADGTGVAHRECAMQELTDVSELDFDSGFGDDETRFNSWTESMERDYGYCR